MFPPEFSHIYYVLLFTIFRDFLYRSLVCLCVDMELVHWVYLWGTLFLNFTGFGGYFLGGIESVVFEGRFVE